MGNVRLYVKWLMSLCLLPPNTITDTFKLIFKKVKGSKNQGLINLFTYFEKTWLTNSNWSITEISQWRSHIRTNNDAECFHMKLMGRVQKSNLDFYELVNILGDIGNYIPITAKLLSQGMIKSTKRRKQKNFETLLTKLTIELMNQQITPMQFISSISESNHDNQLINHDWGVKHSRVDVIDDDNSDTENDNSDTEDEESTESK